VLLYREGKVLLSVVQELEAQQQAVLAGKLKSAMRAMGVGGKREVLAALQAVKTPGRRKEVVEMALAHARKNTRGGRG
jgi:hypothetical protein